jgi:hypothetical protein
MGRRVNSTILDNVADAEPQAQGVLRAKMAEQEAGPVFEDKEKALDFANYFCSYGARTASAAVFLRAPKPHAARVQDSSTTKRTCCRTAGA